jgi:hypothetical protein
LRAPCRGRTGILLVEGQVRYPLLQRSMISRTPPGIRTRSHSLRRRPRCPVALAASGASRRGRTRALPLKRRRCCHYTREAWGRRGLNPHVPLPFPLVISQRGYAPVGPQGVEPCTNALSGRPLHPLGRGQRIAEVPTPNACAPFRVQAGACRPAGLRSIARNEEVPTPTAFTASRFRGGARPRRVLVPRLLSRPV